VNINEVLSPAKDVVYLGTDHTRRVYAGSRRVKQWPVQYDQRCRVVGLRIRITLCMIPAVSKTTTVIGYGMRQSHHQFRWATGALRLSSVFSEAGFQRQALWQYLQSSLSSYLQVLVQFAVKGRIFFSTTAKVAPCFHGAMFHVSHCEWLPKHHPRQTGRLRSPQIDSLNFCYWELVF